MPVVECQTATIQNVPLPDLAPPSAMPEMAVQPEKAAALKRRTTNPVPLLPDARPEDAKKSVKFRRSTTKKYVPVLTANGNVQGVESLQKYNEEKFGKRKFLPLHPWMIATAPVGIPVGILGFAGLRAKQAMFGEKPVESVEPMEHNEITTAEHDRSYSCHDPTLSRFNGMKFNNTNQQHIQRTACGVEREMMERCIKGRSQDQRDSTKTNCQDFVDEFRRCVRGETF